MKTPYISIIMPMYGVEQYIGAAIESVISQSFLDWELLIINDGSKDRSREVATIYVEQDKRIKILDKPNGGLSDARNYGLKYARGKYIHFFDSDDTIESDFYTTLLTHIEKGDYDFIICGYKIDHISSNGNISVTTKPCMNAQYPFNKIIDPTIVISTYFNFAWNKLFRRSFLIQHNLNYEKGLYRIEDSEFMSRVIAFSPKFAFIEYSGYHYINRDRVTLSRLLDDNFLINTARSINIHETILLYFLKSDQSVKYQIQKIIISAYKSLFACVVNTKELNHKQQKQYFKKIVNDIKLRKALNTKKIQGLFNNIVTFCIQHKLYNVIYYIYKLKQPIK